VACGAFVGDRSHEPAVAGVLQAVMDHQVVDLAVPKPVPGARLFQKIRGAGHALHPAGDDDPCIAQEDGAGAEHDRLQAAAADLVDGHGVDGVGKPGEPHRLPGRRLAAAAGQHLADDHLVHRPGIEPASLHQLPDDRRRQLRRPDAGEHAVERAERRA
jgi:hypothetical protein